ncbi:hypothetical protein LOTGIDRAFT_170444 [Lottia gigantea]|uniref:Uncharacterized protein n=1 Tax=Lottia gigantea TaxID=225164 RepID=V3YVM1_LOTGI|nr:hypothetical protein LOTGIDRAFT_170444 [Lottia gigantea]ESO82033.1 hypothetical protein LOTGIDRAFT_170444 [Lottia gigantea]
MAQRSLLRYHYRCINLILKRHNFGSFSDNSRVKLRNLFEELVFLMNYHEYGLCRSSLTALAVKYAEELKTHFEDVLDRLEDLWRLARELDSYTLSNCKSVWNEQGKVPTRDLAMDHGRKDP